MYSVFYLQKFKVIYQGYSLSCKDISFSFFCYFILALDVIGFHLAKNLSHLIISKQKKIFSHPDNNNNKSSMFFSIV